MPQFTKEQMQEARKTDLYEFLMTFHGSQFKREGDSIHPIDNHSLSIKRGFTGYKDFATDDKGNSVDFLTHYLGYTVDEAVFALIGKSESASLASHSAAPSPVSMPEPQQKKKQDFVLPAPAQCAYKNLYAYLSNRGISQNTIQTLIDKKLMYQEAEHNNIVFVNNQRDWAELRGTYDQGDKSFHGMVANGRHDGCWWFNGCKEKSNVAYVCESSIDAISLYELHQLKGITDPAYYVSIGGVAKQDTIDRIKKHYRTIMAVDNDEAGSNCRKRNPELESIIPIKKDWNDDLLDARLEKLAQSEMPKDEHETKETETPSPASSNRLEQIIAAGIAEGIIPEGWQDPFNKPEHAEYMIKMLRIVKLNAKNNKL